MEIGIVEKLKDNLEEAGGMEDLKVRETLRHQDQAVSDRIDQAGQGDHKDQEMVDRPGIEGDQGTMGRSLLLFLVDRDLNLSCLLIRHLGACLGKRVLLVRRGEEPGRLGIHSGPKILMRVKVCQIATTTSSYYMLI